MSKLLIPLVTFCLGTAFSLWLLFEHKWPHSPYPQDLSPINPAPEAIELGPAISVETDELPAPLSASDSAEETEGASQ